MRRQRKDVDHREHTRDVVNRTQQVNIFVDLVLGDFAFNQLTFRTFTGNHEMSVGSFL